MPEILRDKLRELKIVCREPTKLKNEMGISEYYVDVKAAYGDPAVLALIGYTLDSRLNKEATCIAAAGHGGISPATILSVKHSLPLTLIRDRPKNHGRGGMIDGYVPKEGDKAILFDDVFTTGGSLRHMAEVVEGRGAEVVQCLVVVKRGDGRTKIPLDYLFTPEQLI